MIRLSRYEMLKLLETIEILCLEEGEVYKQTQYLRNAMNVKSLDEIKNELNKYKEQ